jgi:phage head maturation protease
MDALISARPRSSSMRRRRAFEMSVTAVPALPGATRSTERVVVLYSAERRPDHQ